MRRGFLGSSLYSSAVASSVHCSRWPQLGRGMRGRLTGHHSASGSIDTIEDDEACRAVSLDPLPLASSWSSVASIASHRVPNSLSFWGSLSTYRARHTGYVEGPHGLGYTRWLLAAYLPISTCWSVARSQLTYR